MTPFFPPRAKLKVKKEVFRFFPFNGPWKTRKKQNYIYHYPEQLTFYFIYTAEQLRVKGLLTNPTVAALGF